MAKKPLNNLNSAQLHLLDALDFSSTQKQVDALMKAVLHDTMLNENKIQFIQEQLHDQRYQIHPKTIANKMFDHLDNHDAAEVTRSNEIVR